MKFIVKCPELDLQFDLDHIMKDPTRDELDEEELLEQLLDALEADGDTDFLWNVVTDAISDYEPSAQGSFDLEEADAALQQIARRNLENARSDFSTLVLVQNDAGEVLDTRTISYFNVLQNMLEEDVSSGEWYTRVSDYIGSHLKKFVEDSTWHYGLRKQSGEIVEDASKWPVPKQRDNGISWNDEGEMQPIIWFGLNSKAPDSRWIYWTREMDEQPEIWNEDFSWNLMEDLVENVNDSFLIWYTAECDCFVPDMGKILNECLAPDAWNNSREEREKIFEGFFYDRWQEKSKSEVQISLKVSK